MKRHMSITVLSLVLLQLVPAKVADAQPGHEPEQSNLALIQQGFEAWRARTGSPFDYLAADATWQITGNSVASRTYIGKEDFLANVIRPFNARMTDPLMPTIRQLYADGDSVIALFDAEALARDGILYRNTYAWFMRMSDGQIVDVVAFFDSIAFDDLWARVTPV